MKLNPARQPLPALARGAIVLHQGQRHRVLRTLPGNRLELVPDAVRHGMQEPFIAHAGPGGWSPVPEADPVATNCN